jgi:predicted ATPase/DNA-binding SARP family transcriptional activator/Tfp pilus assembly protein PilF
MLEERWRITLCGGLVMRQGVQVITRFRTQKTGLLLAYLALNGERVHGREELAELFWPDSERPLHSLRLALASLRQQLEPPGVGQGQVLAASRTHVGLAAGTVRTDVGNFRAVIADAARASSSGEKVRLLRQGVEAMGGELLPGSYEEWVLQAREVLGEQMQGALKELVGLLTDQEEWEQALLFALRWAHLNSLNEEAHLAVMQILLALRRPGDALQQFQRLRVSLWDEMRTAPSQEVCALANAAGAGLETAVEVVEAGERLRANSTVVSVGAEAAVTSGSAPLRAAAVVPVGSRSVVRLPLPLTPFFGREQDLQRLCSLLTPDVAGQASESGMEAVRTWKPRVVTLLGTGGSGKTRLAIEAARVCAAEAETTVCFVALVDADTAERMVQLIAETVCPNASADLAPHDVILSTLDGVSALLILDNMEQIAEEGAEVLGGLLQRLPDLTALVTSRVRLNLDGEREFVLGALPTPAQVDTPECLLEFASVQLFVDRAQAACADFQLTVRNAGHVAALCRRLEGLPLALELAASWAQTLSPAQMLGRLDRRFDLLRARRKGMASRHQALEVCIEWSFRLLPADVQAFFCRLCLLRGEWTLETAEVIAADNEALDKVQRLREASFLLAQEAVQADGPTLRFHMLESLREFGLKQLDPAEIDAGYEHLTRHIIAARTLDALRLIHTENVRTAVHWSRYSARGTELELRLINALKMFWFSRGAWMEGRDWVQDALRRHVGETTSAYRNAWNMLGSLHWLLHETVEARRCFEEALAIAEQAGDDALAVRVLNNLAMTATQEGDLVRACALGEQSLVFARRLGDEILVTALMNNVGSAHMALKQYETARGYLEESLRRSREQGTPAMAGNSLANLAGVAEKLGDGGTARRMYEESLELLRACEDQSGVVEVLRFLAGLLEEQGEAVQARRLLAERDALLQRLEGG